MDNQANIGDHTILTVSSKSMGVMMSYTCTGSLTGSVDNKGFYKG